MKAAVCLKYPVKSVPNLSLLQFATNFVANHSVPEDTYLHSDDCMWLKYPNALPNTTKESNQTTVISHTVFGWCSSH